MHFNLNFEIRRLATSRYLSLESYSEELAEINCKFKKFWDKASKKIITMDKNSNVIFTKTKTIIIMTLLDIIIRYFIIRYLSISNKRQNADYVTSIQRLHLKLCLFSFARNFQSQITVYISSKPRQFSLQV